MNITVVLCTYNRCDLLKLSLKALLDLDFQKYEIVVVNDGSVDGTKIFLDSLSNPKIKVIHNKKNVGLSNSRNIGIRHSSGEIVVFTDDDCLADKSWLENISKYFKQPHISFVIGRTYYKDKQNQGYFPERIVQNARDNWPMGCNIAYRKGVFQKIGLFEDEYFKYGNEDTEMALRAVNYGLKYEIASDATVFHQKTLWTRKSLLKSARNVAAWVRLSKKYPKVYLKFGSPLKGKIIYSKDYLILFFWPILVPIILIRYLYHGQNDLKIFFYKWPIYFFLRRYYIWQESVRERKFIL